MKKDWCSQFSFDDLKAIKKGDKTTDLDVLNELKINKDEENITDLNNSQSSRSTKYIRATKKLLISIFHKDFKH